MSTIKEWEYKLPESLKESEPDPDHPGEERLIDKPCPIEGVVKLKILMGSERMKMYKDMHFKVNPSGELVKKASIEMTPDLIKIAEDAILSVDAKQRGGGAEYKSMEDLSFDEDGLKILMHLGSVVINGIKLGKK